MSISGSGDDSGTVRGGVLNSNVCGPEGDAGQRVGCLVEQPPHARLLDAVAALVDLVGFLRIDPDAVRIAVDRYLQLAAIPEPPGICRWWQLISKHGLGKDLRGRSVETLSSQFGDAVRNVTLHGEKAKRAQDAQREVRAVLEADPTLKEWGIDPILIGSYARQTARYPGKDVDIFLRLLNRTNRFDPEIIYNRVRDVLVDEYGPTERGGRVTQQARSLKIDFAAPNLPDDQQFSVDAVPAVKWGDTGHWGIPNRNRDLWRKDESRWIQTNPVQFAADTNALAVSDQTPTVDGANAYRPVVRLMRQIRHVHLGDARPGGLAVEVGCFHAWKTGSISGGSYAELLASTLDAVAAEFRKAADKGLADPVFGTKMQPELSPSQWNDAAWRLEDFAAMGRDALAADKCRAAKIWRDILGTNDRGQVLPLPDGCDAAGFPIRAVTAVGAVGSNDPRGFA